MNFVDEIIKNDSDSQIAMRDQFRSISYFELKNKILKISQLFLNLNLIKKSNIIIIFSNQTIDSIIIFLAAIHAGKIPTFMPLPSNKVDPEKFWNDHINLFEITHPELIIYPDDFFDEISKSKLIKYDLKDYSTFFNINKVFNIEQAASNSLAFLQHSSGTTNLKKGVMISHTALILQVESYSKSLNISKFDKVVTWLPIYHDMGLIACTLLPLIKGCEIIILDPHQWVTDPLSLLHVLSIHRAQWVWMPNFAFDLISRILTKNKKNFVYDFSSFKAFINCSETCKLDTFMTFYDCLKYSGLRKSMLHTCYAMAETVFAVSQSEINSEFEYKIIDNSSINNLDSSTGSTSFLSSGKLIDNIEIEISNPNKFGIGQIVVKSKFLFDGYYNRKEISDKKLINNNYYTGDIGLIENNNLYVLGRIDDLLIINGKNYFAHEIEDLIYDLNYIKKGRVIAFGMPSSITGSNDLIIITELINYEIDKKILIREIKKSVKMNFNVDVNNVFIVSNGWLLKSSSGKIARVENFNKFKREFLNG